MSYVLESFLPANTYPRLRTVPSGVNKDKIYVFFRDIVEKTWGYVTSTTPRDGTATLHFGNPTYIAYYPPSQSPEIDTTMYCGGVVFDKNNRCHFIINFQDGDRNYSEHRALAYAYSDDMHVWKNLDGTHFGTSNSSPTDSSLMDYDKAYIITESTNYATGTRPHTNNGGLRITNSGTIYFSYTKMPAASNKSWWINLEGEPYVAKSNGLTWSTINLYDKTGYKIWKHRHAGVLQYYWAGSINRYVMSYFGFVKTENEEVFGGELMRWNTIDDGVTWSTKFLTRNSSKGIPMMGGVPSCIDGPDIVIGRMENIELYDGTSPGTTFIPAGDDVRLVYGEVEIPRLVANYWNYENSIINFAAQATIQENTESTTAYYLYYGNYFALATPPRSTGSIYRLYDSFEGYNLLDVPTANAWTLSPAANSNTYVIRSYGDYSGSHTNKLYDGDKSFRMQGNSYSYSRHFPTIGKYSFEIQAAHWTETNNSGYSCCIKYKDTTPTILLNNGSFEQASVGSTLGWSIVGSQADGSLSVATTSARASLGSYSILQTSGPSTVYAISDLYEASSINTVIVAAFPSISTEAILRNDVPSVYVAANTGQTLASLLVISFTAGTWNTISLPVPPTNISSYVVKLSMTANPTGDSQCYWDNVRVTAPTKFFENRINGLSERAEVRNNSNPTWIQKGVANQFVESQYHLNKIIIGTRIESYFDGFNTGTFYSFNNNGSLPSIITFYNNSAEQFLDHIVIRDWVSNTPSAVATPEVIKDHTGSAQLMNTVSLAYFRSERIMHEVQASKEFLTFIANFLVLEHSFVVRLAESLKVEKTNSKRLASLILGDRELQSRMYELLKVNKEIYDRFSNIANASKTVLTRVAEIVVADKEKYNRIVNIALLNKEAESRSAQLLNVNKEFQIRLAHKLISDKELLDRVASYITLEDSLYDEISNIIKGDKILTQRVSNILLSDKELLNIIANIVIGDKELEDRMAGILRGDKELENRIANFMLLDDELKTLIANTLLGDKELLDELSNELIVEQTLKDRLAMVANVNKELAIDEVVNVIIGDKEKLNRLAQFIKVNQPAQDRIANTTRTDKELKNRITNFLDLSQVTQSLITHILINDKEVLDELANQLIVDQTQKSRIANIVRVDRQLAIDRVVNDLVGSKEKLERLSQFIKVNQPAQDRIYNVLKGDKEVEGRLAHFMNLNFSAQIRAANALVSDKELLERMANELIVEQTLKNRVSEIVIGSKELIAREANIILGDKEKLKRLASFIKVNQPAQDRIYNIAFTNKELSDRAAQIAKLDKELVERIASNIKGDKELQARVSNFIAKDKTLLSRIGHKILTNKTKSGEINNIVLMDKELLFRVAMRVFGDKAKSLEIANSMVMEDILSARIINSIISDKALTNRAASIISGDKELVSRVSNLLSFATTSLAKFIETTDLEAHREERLRQLAVLLATKLVRIIESADLEKTKIDKISEIVNLEKTLTDSKFAEFVDLSAIKISLFAQKADFQKTFFKKLVETVQLNKLSVDMYTETISFLAHEVISFSQDASLLATKLRRFSETLEFLTETESLAQFANSLKLDATKKELLSNSLKLLSTKFERFSQYINLVGNKIERLSQTALLEKTALGKFSENIKFSPEELLTAKISQFVQLEGNRVLRLSELVELIQVTMPDLIFAQNERLSRSYTKNRSLKSSTVTSVDIV